MTKLTWTTGLATTAAVGLLMTAATPDANARPGHGYNVCRGAVHAVGHSRGYGPRFLKRLIARRKAIMKWRRKVRRRYGPGFVRWRLAAARYEHVEGGKRRVIVAISGRPCNPYLRRHARRHDRYDRYDRRDRHDRYDERRPRRRNRH